MDETKKYIIEFSEDPHTIRLLKLKNGDKYPVTEFKTVTPYTEPDLERVRKEAFEEGKKQAKVQAELDVCHDIEKVAKGNYKAGLSDAWDAARKIASDNAGRNYSIFGQHFTVEILNTHSASECIEKIRQYEQANEKDGLRQNIQTIIDQCGYSLDEICEIVQEMKEAQ